MNWLLTTLGWACGVLSKHGKDYTKVSRMRTVSTFLNTQVTDPYGRIHLFPTFYLEFEPEPLEKRGKHYHQAKGCH